jgi:hypothetical protein
MNASMTETERVRRNTAPKVNARIDRQIAETVYQFVGQSASEITRRIDEIEREWDIERVLETNASALALTGVGLAAASTKRWLMLPAIVLSFLFMHGTQGWCPPVPLFRRLGVRTRSEIERERFALKFLRGDFNEIIRDGTQVSSDALLAALRR